MQTKHLDIKEDIDLIKTNTLISKKHNDTNFLKFLATIFITNSHCDAFFPFKFLGTGGAIANCLFFVVSGYAITLSQSINLPFLKWFSLRIKRIYPSVIIMSLFTTILPNINKLNINYLFSKLIFPTNYWFIAAIILFYALFYFVNKLENKNKYLIVIGILTIPYFYFYKHMNTSQWVIEGQGHFKWILYFQIMLFGGYLSTIKNKLNSINKNDFIITMILIFSYFGFKILTYKYLIFMETQFILHLLSFPIVYYMFKISKSEFINKIMKYLNKLTTQILILINNF